MKALVGSWDHRPHRLLAENAALRTRVAELELALRQAREERELLTAALQEAAEVQLDAEIVLSRS